MQSNVIQKRLQNLREKLKKADLDAVFVTGEENCRYLSGFTGTSAYLVITECSAVLLTDFRYTEQAAKQSPLYEIVQYAGNIVNALNETILNSRIEKLAFEDLRMNVKDYNEYREKLDVLEFKPFGEAIEELRRVKDDAELELIRKAVKIADNAFIHVLSYIKPGVSEVEIAAELEYFMKRQGAARESFETIVASGKRSSMPHGVASEKKLEAGDVITMDFGALYQGYCSDMTRTVFLGKPDDELKKIYGIVLNAQKKAAVSVVAGRTGSEIDSIARLMISEAGFGDNFGHGLGHGVGLEIHENPRLSINDFTKMRDGMVVTVEPGIYIPGLGGVRIEDMVVVNGNNPEIMTGSTKEMIVI